MNVYRKFRNVIWRASMSGLSRGPHITRYYMYNLLRSVGANLQLKPGRVLRPGGVAIHTTCFINPIHGYPSDFWRFTPDALALLHRNWSVVHKVGGWGNRRVWSVVADGLRFAGVPHARWHPMHTFAMQNDPLWPIVTWVVARK
jgi:hypothetical protein